MFIIKKVENELMANECDDLLTQLIQSERLFDDNVKETFKVKDNYKNKYDKDYNALFLAYYDNMPVGFVFGYWKLETGDFVYNSTGKIEALYVLETYRKQGIATSLMNEFYRWCRQKNIKTVEIGVFCKNNNAYELYKSQGFETVIYYMEKKL